LPNEQVSILHAVARKKGKNQKYAKIAPFADPLPVAPRQPNFACRVVSRISSVVLSFKKDRLGNVGTVGVDILAFPLTRHVAYITATAQAVTHLGEMPGVGEFSPI